MSEQIIWRVNIAVPSNGVPIWSEIDFDEFLEAEDFAKKVYDEGQVSDYEIWKIVKISTEELIVEEHRE
jgi:hypothetical protein